MKNITYSLKKLSVILSVITMAGMLAACGAEKEPEKTDETVTESKVENNDAVDKAEATPEVDEKATKADAAMGEWVMVYNLYHSEYEGDETYDGCTMCSDPYAVQSFMNISKKDGKLVADYRYSGYESEYRYYGNELVVKEEAAYDGCENKDWYFSFYDPYGEENSFGRYTMINDDTLVGISEYREDGEYSYYSLSQDVYYRKSDPRLQDEEGLRYFDTVTVSDTEDLLNNIQNNRKIILEAGTYDFSAVNRSKIDNEHVFWDYDGLRIQSVSNFCIEAKEGANVLICVDDAYEPVIHFIYGNNITLRGIIAGHNVEPGYCSGSVASFESINGIRTDNCRLYGCGTYGIEANSCENIEVTGCDIYECTYGLIDFTNVYTAHFKDCTLRDSKDMSMIVVNSGYDISFENCSFKNNYCDEKWTSVYFVELSEYTDVTFTDCVFENNQYNSFANRKVKQINCRISDNGDPDTSNIETSGEATADSIKSRYDEAVKRQNEIDAKFQKGDLDQLTMNQLAFEEYDLWDSLINDLWGYLRNTLDEQTMDAATEEQKTWIKEKEASVKAAGADFEGGSMQPMIEYGTGAEITKKRVEYLMDRYMK